MDHLAPPMAEQHDMYEAITTNAWLLAHTERLVQGQLVLCDAFRHPANLAREAVTLDHASGGRFELGIGWGSVVEEFTTYGVRPIAARERVGRLKETLEIVRALWDGEVVDYEGEWFQLVAARQTAAQGGSYEQTKALVAGIARARINWGTVIGNVATVAPRQVWLTNLSVETPQGTPSATTPGTAAAAAAAAQTPTAIHMDGGAFTRDQVARMMVRLQAVPGLGEPKLTTVDVVKATTGTSRDSLKFSLDIPINQRILGARVQPGASYPSTATTPTP